MPSPIPSTGNCKTIYETALSLEFGGNAGFWKHKDLLFNAKHKALKQPAMPDILLFQNYIIPIFTPIADFFTNVDELARNNAGKISVLPRLYRGRPCLTASVAFTYTQENRHGN
jgi:hypothetical protein